MNEKIILKTALTVVLATGIIAGGTYAYNNLKFSSDPEQVVSSFYQEWLSHEGNPMADKIYKNHPNVSDEFENKIDSIIAGFNGGGYDPVLLAQDKPLEIGFEISHQDEENAVVSVREDFGGNEKVVKVDLLVIDGKWQINDIRDSQSEIPLASAMEIQNQVEGYVRQNISDLSEAEAVLGGSFYVTRVEFLTDSRALVDYEDGHIALSAEFDYELLPDGNVGIDNFEIIND